MNDDERVVENMVLLLKSFWKEEINELLSMNNYLYSLYQCNDYEHKDIVDREKNVNWKIYGFISFG